MLHYSSPCPILLFLQWRHLSMGSWTGLVPNHHRILTSRGMDKQTGYRIRVPYWCSIFLPRNHSPFLDSTCPILDLAPFLDSTSPGQFYPCHSLFQIVDLETWDTADIAWKRYSVSESLVALVVACICWIACTDNLAPMSSAYMVRHLGNL